MFKITEDKKVHYNISVCANSDDNISILAPRNDDDSYIELFATSIGPKLNESKKHMMRDRNKEYFEPIREEVNYNLLFVRILSTFRASITMITKIKEEKKEITQLIDNVKNNFNIDEEIEKAEFDALIKKLEEDIKRIVPTYKRPERVQRLIDVR